MIIKKKMTFMYSGNVIAHAKYRFRNEEHEVLLEKSRKKLVSEYTKIPQKNIIVFIDEVLPYTPKPLKKAA